MTKNSTWITVTALVLLVSLGLSVLLLVIY
jgi:hypothetical protein